MTGRQLRLRLLSWSTAAWIVAVGLVCRCTIPTGEESGAMEMLGGADTVSAFPTLRFILSSPARESFLMVVEPDPGSIYYTVLNARRDTAVLVVTGVLAGNTGYQIRPDRPLTLEGGGGTLRPEESTFTIYTHATEQEPNDGPDSGLADLFVDPIFRVVSTGNDTDYYIMPHPSPAAVYVRSHDAGRCNFALIDQAGRRVTARTKTSVGAGPGDTITVGDTLVPPLRVQVFSFTGAAGLRYELGAVGERK